MRTKNLLAAALAFAAAVGLSRWAVAEDPPAAARNVAPAGEKVEVAQTFRSGQIIGLPVRNKAGQNLGSINDLVVELNTGKICYAALAHGGFAGIGAKLFAVPWQAMTFVFGERDHHFVFDVTEEELKKAPGFDTYNWPNVADPKWAAAVKPNSAAPAEEPAARDEVGPAGQIAADHVYRVSVLKGMKVRNPAHEDLGHLYEFVLHVQEGQVGYAVLSHGSIAGIGGKLFAIPLDAFQLKHQADDKFFVLDVSAAKLKEAPGFDASNWPDLASPDWARDIDRHWESIRTAAKPTRTE
jgi:sporulation protein YlmC with PRC-barrel domain